VFGSQYNIANKKLQGFLSQIFLTWLQTKKITRDKMSRVIFFI